jgi:hypothetical protein
MGLNNMTAVRYHFYRLLGSNGVCFWWICTDVLKERVFSLPIKLEQVFPKNGASIYQTGARGGAVG